MPKSEIYDLEEIMISTIVVRAWNRYAQNLAEEFSKQIPDLELDEITEEKIKVSGKKASIFVIIAGQEVSMRIPDGEWKFSEEKKTNK
jgi:hypothetical protein